MITVGVDTYASLEYALNYFESRIDKSEWFAVTNVKREQALVTATAILDDLLWIGTAESVDQLLAFPKAGRYFDPRLGIVVTLPPKTVNDGMPKRIQDATCELAYHLLLNENLLSDTGSISNLQVSTINLGNIRPAALIPVHVKRMIKPLLSSDHSFAVFRVN